MPKPKINKFPDPSVWASWKPFGLGEQHPDNFSEVFRAAWESRDNLDYAWRILNDGCCDGCALGTTGMQDWTLDGVHLCNIRLRLLRLNTMGALDINVLEYPSRLGAKKGRLPRAGELRELGRLPYPMLREAGDVGFRRIAWDEALDRIAARVRATHPVENPNRIGFYLTSRGIPNETYYGAQKAARAMGTNSVDNAARLCHSPSTVGLKHSLGVGATTCSYSDWIESDLIVFFGSNVANNQPVATKYLHYAKKAGARVVCVNNYAEPGMDRYWIPSIPESALFGTQITDRFHLINIGGDLAFIQGALKHIFANGWHDADFVEKHTLGLDELRRETDARSWEELEALSGASREEMLEFAQSVHQADRAVFVWSMGITQHEFGSDGVKSIINLALTKGFVGRTGCGLMPIRGHSGVQGGAEMGCYTTAFPGGREVNAENARWLSEQWAFDVPAQPGLIAPQMIDAAHAGKLDVLFSVGGNFLEVLPQPDYVEEALGRIPLRVHMDIVLSPQMFVEPTAENGEVILLPATTRYEIPGGVTETSTERRIIFSPEIPGPRIGEARPESDVLLDLARRVRPEIANRLHFTSTTAMREEIARVVPFYDGIQHLAKKGDHFQYGGPHLCADWEFPTADGKAHFAPVDLPDLGLSDDPDDLTFLVTTRRGKQFNSIIHERTDSFNGATREAVLMNKLDAERLGVADGDAVRLHNSVGELMGHVFLAPVAPGNVQVHWPEGNVLLERGCREPQAGVPDYNGVVRIAPILNREEFATK